MSKQISNEEFNLAYINKDNINTIKKVTSKYWRQIDADDLEECGLQGLWNCLRSHEEGHNQKFTTSLYTFVNWECLRKLQKQKKKVKTFSIQDFSEFNLNHRSLKQRFKNKEVFYNESCQPINTELADVLETLNRMCGDDKELLIDYYYHQMSMTEIAFKSKSSKESVRKKINKAIGTIKLLYGNDE